MRRNTSVEADDKVRQIAGVTHGMEKDASAAVVMLRHHFWIIRSFKVQKIQTQHVKSVQS